jgi:hypothetical protein
MEFYCRFSTAVKSILLALLLGVAIGFALAMQTIPGSIQEPAVGIVESLLNGRTRAVDPR